MNKYQSCTLIGENLGLSRGLLPVFSAVNLSITPAMVLMIRGENGTGKTSLLRILAGFTRSFTGLLRHQCDSEHWQDGAPATQISWLGHKNSNKHELTAEENLAFWLPKSQHKSRISEVLDKVEISKIKHQPVSALSAGQQRRLSLARLLLGHHPIWLLDEPTANLDQAGSRLLEQLLVEHIEQNGSAIIASHEVLQPDVQTSVIKLQARVSA